MTKSRTLLGENILRKMLSSGNDSCYLPNISKFKHSIYLLVILMCIVSQVGMRWLQTFFVRPSICGRWSTFEGFVGEACVYGQLQGLGAWCELLLKGITQLTWLAGILNVPG